MNFNIPYFIDARIEEAMDEALDPETGEIVDESKLDLINKLNMEKNEAIEGIGLYYKDVVAAAKSVKEEKDRLAEEQKVLERRAESLKNHLSKVLNGDKFKTPRLSVSYRKSKKVVVDDITKIPANCLVWKKPEADKTHLKKLIEEGVEEVNGAHIEENNSVIIK